MMVIKFSATLRPYAVNTLTPNLRAIHLTEAEYLSCAVLSPESSPPAVSGSLADAGSGLMPIDVEVGGEV
jgi:hypothetical protein